MPKARPRKDAGGGDEGPSKAWLDSYADAMTLLLAFFILLYSFSLVDKEKFIDFKLGVAVAFGKNNPTVDGGIGILDRGNGIASLIEAPPVVTENGDGAEGEEPDKSAEGDGEELTEVTEENAAEVAQELQERIDEVGASELVSVAQDPRGLVIRFDSKVLFRSGDAKLLPDGVTVLDAIDDVLRSIDNLLVVEGHTDNVPTDGERWPTNWELSTSRATNVLRYLVELRKVPAVRVSAAGYADTRPRASNRTEEGRALNRRVDIIVVIERAAEAALDPADQQAVDEATELAEEAITDPARPDVVPDSILDFEGSAE